MEVDLAVLRIHRIGDHMYYSLYMTIHIAFLPSSKSYVSNATTLRVYDYSSWIFLLNFFIFLSHHCNVVVIVFFHHHQ